jgi:hypothetical protein
LEEADRYYSHVVVPLASPKICHGCIKEATLCTDRVVMVVGRGVVGPGKCWQRWLKRVAAGIRRHVASRTSDRGRAMQSVEAVTGGLAGMDFQHQRRRAMNLTYRAGLLLHNSNRHSEYMRKDVGERERTLRSSQCVCDGSRRGALAGR